VADVWEDANLNLVRLGQKRIERVSRPILGRTYVGMVGFVYDRVQESNEKVPKNDSNALKQKGNSSLDRWMSMR